MKDVVVHGPLSRNMNIRQNDTISKTVRKDDSIAASDPSVSSDMMNPISLCGSRDLLMHRQRHRSASIRQTSLRRRIVTRQDQSNGIQSELDLEKKPFSYIASLIQDFQWALTDLGWECTDLGSRRSVTSLSNQKVSDERKMQIEKWACFVDNSLTGYGRAVHGLSHIMEVSELASSLQFLAAAFRDVISYSVCSTGVDTVDDDNCVDDVVLSKHQEEIISDVLYREWKVGVSTDGREIGSKRCTVVRLSSDVAGPTDVVVCSIFGHKPGDDLKPFAGLNRGLDVFLSTLTVARLLKSVLSLAQIAQLATIMQATIPIRNIDDNASREWTLEDLFIRLGKCNQKFKLSLNDDTMIETVQLGADLRNRLFGYMATPDLAMFLGRVWNILPERNPRMRDLALYTITEYYKSIESTTALVSTLDSQSFFCGFQGLPSANEITTWQVQCSSNLLHLQLYMEARLLSVAIVLYLAQLTGGVSAPNTFFFGDIPSIRNTKPERLGDRIDLPDELVPFDNGIVDQTVYRLLRGDDEKLQMNEFDTQSAPLAAYIYKELGPRQIKDVLKHCVVPCDADYANRILKLLPFRVLETIGREFGELTKSRKAATNQLIQEIENSDAATSMYFL